MWVAAVAAVVLRVPGALWPIRPDEAGFTMVARTWQPRPGSMYGHYWVDRPPLLLEVVRISDSLGGALFIRALGALACGVLVLAAAAFARSLAAYAGQPARADRAAVWTAVGTTAVVSNAMIDLVAVKGEILALPLLVGSFTLALRAVMSASPRLAFAAGLTGALALGLKQNLVAGLVFAGALITVAWWQRRLTWRQFGWLAGAVTAGAALPVLGTVAWAVTAGVRLHTLWYAVYGFRSDASQVIWSQPAHAPLMRARMLVVIFVATGMALVLGWFVWRLRRLVRDQAPVAVATLAVLAVDLLGVAMGGSYWRPYLFGLVPACVLALGLLTTSEDPLARRRRLGAAATKVVSVLVASSTVALGGWVMAYARTSEPPTEVRTGQAIHEASHPRDTLVIYGGRADLQLTSGLRSPYRHLWSLPSRTLDPGAEKLSRLLASRRAPTWFVPWVAMDAWDPSVEQRLDPILQARYVEHGAACNGRPVYLRKGLERPPLVLGCTTPWWKHLADLREREWEDLGDPQAPGERFSTGPQRAIS